MEQRFIGYKEESLVRNEKNLLGFGCMRFPVLEENDPKSNRNL